MRIGLFSDTYHPSTNGIVIVIDTLYDNLVKQGHQVTIVAPRPGLRNRHNPKIPGRKIIWLPAFEALIDDNLVGLYSPGGVARRLSAMDFEVIVIFTPAQTGLIGAYVAKKNHIPLVEQYCTDLVEYVKHYPSVIPAILALSLTVPFALKMNVRQVAAVFKKLLARRQENITWSQKTVSAILAGLHNSCDLVICVSEKNVQQLRNLGVRSPVKCLPTGVDRLPVNAEQVRRFKRKCGLSMGDFTILYLGRLGAEKNLDVLVDAHRQVVKKLPDCKLLLVGGFEYRESLERRVRANGMEDSVIFTGRLPHHKLGAVYATADVFVFPSLTDTQALVLNEAAHAGLPLVWCDKDVNSVAQSGVNAILVKPRARDLANAILDLAGDDAKRKAMAAESKIIARRYSETKMTARFARALKTTVKNFA